MTKPQIPIKFQVPMTKFQKRMIHCENTAPSYLRWELVIGIYLGFGNLVIGISVAGIRYG